MSFPASIVPIEFQIIRCISIQNGIPYLTDADKFKLNFVPHQERLNSSWFQDL